MVSCWDFWSQKVVGRVSYDSAVRSWRVLGWFDRCSPKCCRCRRAEKVKYIEHERNEMERRWITKIVGRLERERRQPGGSEHDDGSLMAGPTVAGEWVRHCTGAPWLVAGDRGQSRYNSGCDQNQLGRGPWTNSIMPRGSALARSTQLLPLDPLCAPH